MFWVISVYFNIRNTLPKSGTFLLGHPVCVCVCVCVYVCVCVCMCVCIYIYNKTSIKRNILTIKQSTSGSRWGLRTYHHPCILFFEGLLDTLTFLSFPTCFAKTISCCIFARTFQTSLHSAMWTHRNMRDGVAKGELESLVFFSQYVTHVPTPSCHV